MSHNGQDQAYIQLNGGDMGITTAYNYAFKYLANEVRIELINTETNVRSKKIFKLSEIRYAEPWNKGDSLFQIVNPMGDNDPNWVVHSIDKGYGSGYLELK